MADSALREKQKTLPAQPGVYLWKDGAGTVLYVGKANNLRARTGQYFQATAEEKRVELMERARDVDFLAVNTVKEALVLEQTLIKRHNPPYNVRLADDKSYPYIAITDEEWPRVIYTRDLRLGGTYFGPFPDAYKAKRVARMLNQTFQLRQCRTLPKRECLYFHMHQCSAPCIQAVTPADYAKQTKAATDFLRGRGDSLQDRLRQEMQQAAAELRYERAAELRDLSRAVDSVLERQRMDSVGGQDYDAIGAAHRGGRWCAVVLWVREGAVVGREHYFLNAPEGTAVPALLAAFTEQLYATAPLVPREILLPTPLEGDGSLEQILSEIHQHAVRFTVPERGARRQQVQVAEKNAELLLEQEFLLRERRGPQALEELRDALELAEPPAAIDCFDVSHHAGEHTVASLVTFRDGKPYKNGYRRFKIRGVSGGDDPHAMQEAIQRRYLRLMEEEGVDALPDLIVVDGGRLQVDAATETMKALGLDSVPLVGLAKRHEEIIRPKNLHPLRLDPASPGLHVLMRARDEAHRFAIGYQGVLKRKNFVTSALDDIPGIGPERRRRLLTTFGSLENLALATPQEIAKVPGIPAPLAVRVWEALHENKPSSMPSE